MQALDELVARWRKNPDPESTLALCAHLGTSHEAALLREVGNTAEAWHRDNPSVMLSVGRMYLDAGFLAEAQAAFIQAGKARPNDAAAYRFLGEVLLRRGDALRSEKTLARAIRMGHDDAQTRLWHERSIVYVALQTRRGEGAVADEVARTAPHQPSIPAPSLSPVDRVDHGVGGTQWATRRSRPALGANRPGGKRRSAPPAALRRRPSSPAPVKAVASAKAAPLDTLLMGHSPLPRPPLEAPVHPPSPFFRSGSHAPRAPDRTSLDEHHDGAGLRSEGAPSRDSTSHPPLRREAIPPELPNGAGSRDRAPPTSARAELAPTSASASRGSRRSEAVQTRPEAVLRQLARETSTPVVPAWEAAPRPLPQRLWVLAGVLLIASGIGVLGYQHTLSMQTERLARAQELSMRLSGSLGSGSRRQLSETEPDFRILFELDARGREPALLWLEKSALHTLLEAAPVSGIEDALQRARTLGIEESRLVFGRLASALGADDLPGASALIEEWDERAQGDPLYQLMAGAVLERAGSPEALDRYVRATTLQPDFKLAQAFAARLALLQGGPAARSVVEIACARLEPGPAAAVLRRLDWASSPLSEAAAPPAPSAALLRDLPPLLQSAASAVAGVEALREGRRGDCVPAFERALGPGSTPALARWVGDQAIDWGETEIARLAASKAVTLSAPHATSHAFAARIALAEGRLAAAREAHVEPSSRDAVLIGAVTAYENLRGAEAVRLVETLPADLAASSTLEALRESNNAILSLRRPKDERLEQLATPRRLWGSVIAVDLALDSGRLDAASRMIASGRWDVSLPTFALRSMRLARYQGHAASALELAPALLDPTQATPRSVSELVLAFVAAGRNTAAASTLRDMGEAAGDLRPWLEALVEAARGRQPSAAKMLSGLSLPKKSEPVLHHVVALRALSQSRDRRARSYWTELARRLRVQPDVVLSGKQLGLVK